MMVEIPEAEATGSVARCYADIRDRLQVPLVNLIWRHLAAIGELDACWQRVRSDLPDLSAAGAALNGLTRSLATTLPGLQALPHAAAASRILVSYERGNSLNLAIVRTLLGHPVINASGSLPETPAALPPIPAFGELPQTLRAAIERLSLAGPASPTGIRPTLWVHLALLPEWLEAAAQTVPACLNSSSFRDAHQRLTAPDPAPRVDDTLSEAARSALSRFNSRIGEMLLIGVHLERTSTIHPGIHS